MKKNLIAVPALCGAGLFLLCGCFSGDNARDDLLNYLEARYTQDDFTFHSYELQPEQNELKKTEICVSSKLFPDADLRALRWQKDGKWVYRDNYMAYYLHDDVEAYMHDIAESIFGACKVYLDLPWGVYTPESYPTDADAEYYLKSKPQCGFAVYLPPGQSKENAAENLKEFTEKLKEKQFFGISGGVRIIKEQEAYDEISSFDGPAGGFIENPVCEFIGGFEV